jgi:hypothetical protein
MTESIDGARSGSPEDVLRYLRETRGEDERANRQGRSLSVGFRARGGAAALKAERVSLSDSGC